MIIFVDASALVAMIANEPDAASLARVLEQYDDRRTSALALWETAVGVSRLSNGAMTPMQAGDVVEALLSKLGIEVDPREREVYSLALDAFERFGKGRHPAGLNMGDCFAYAGAKVIGGALLYKGDDFSRTDLAEIV